MLRSVTEVMMVLFRRVGTICALQRIRPGQFPDSNCIVHGNPGKYVVRMKFLDLKIFFPHRVLAFFALVISFMCLFTFCALFIPFLSLFEFLALGISFYGLFTFCTLAIEPLVGYIAVFALIFMTILFLSIFVEFGKRLDFFAMGTSFGYDWFKHDLWSLKVRRLCLEPVARYAYHWLALFSHMNVKYQ